MSDGSTYDVEQREINVTHVAITPRGLELGGYPTGRVHHIPAGIVRETVELPEGTPRTDYVVSRVDGDRIELSIAPITPIDPCLHAALDRLLELSKPERVASALAIPAAILYGDGQLREYSDRPNRSGIRLRRELPAPSSDEPVFEDGRTLEQVVEDGLRARPHHRPRGQLGDPHPEDVPIAELLERGGDDDDDVEYICKCLPDLEDADGTCAECRARGRVR